MASLKIFFGRVYHKRLIPKVNQFNYRTYYLFFPITKIKELSRNFFFRVNKFAILSFYQQDHFPKSNFTKWVTEILTKHNIKIELGEVILMAMPRVLGYVFNPVSFWFCLNKDKQLKAVIAEVRNTFGESHNYLCFKKDLTTITKGDIIVTKKIFHVSPFIKREGSYQFNFSYNYEQDKVGIWINYFNSKDEKLLVTSLIGKLYPYNTTNLLYAFIFYPLITAKTIFLIHLQALKLFIKGIKYIQKPGQLKVKLSTIIKKNK
ncbi:MAG: DUF1365 domain-containing protein [Rickettsiaceae bacterium]|nr:DUF1365 domain-containing protein [Rickettsiaceae bacterium]